MNTNLNLNQAIDWQRPGAWHIASIGECMIELSGGPELRQYFAGDTMNTATYLVRELVGTDHHVDYVTVIGKDSFSKHMLEVFDELGIGVSLIAEHSEKTPGLCWVKTDDVGERTFHYWRNDSAAKCLMKCLPETELVNHLKSHNMLYLSGISLAILSDVDKRNLLSALVKLRQHGCAVAFDSNYRSTLWNSSDHAREWIAKAFRIADLALVSFDDEKALFGDKLPSESLARISEFGVPEIVVKNGADTCYLLNQGKESSVRHVEGVDQVDSTAGGDSFNAAYIAARISGLSATEAVTKGHNLAARVVQHHGAIIPDLTHLKCRQR